MRNNYIRQGLEAAETALQLDGHAVGVDDTGRAVLAFLRALPHLSDGSNLWRLAELEQWIVRDLAEIKADPQLGIAPMRTESRWLTSG